MVAALQMMFLKYQLPSEPNVYVDLLDDEDVSLMFDEVRTSPPHCLLACSGSVRVCHISDICGKSCKSWFRQSLSCCISKPCRDEQLWLLLSEETATRKAGKSLCHPLFMLPD